MKQCLYCDKPCAETAIFCDGCRSLLLKRQQQRTIDLQEQDSDLSRLLSDSWPELAYENSDASGDVTVVAVNQPDPLLQRRLPNSNSSLLERDAPVHTQPLQPGKQKTAAPHSEDSTPVSLVKTRGKVKSRIHMIFAVLVCLAVLVIIVDGSLLVLGFSHHRNTSAGNSPAISVTPHVVLRGQMALVHLSHFPPHANIFLTHDIEQLLPTDSGSPLILLGPDGSSNVHILIEPGWSPGSHTIEAEDVRTRDTISTTLQVVDGHGTHAPVCGVTASQTRLAFSIAAEQAQPLTQSVMLQSSNCAEPERWQASSFASWLSMTPTSGQLTPGSSVMVTVRVNGSGLAATSSSYIAFTTNQQTQLLAVQVTIAKGAASGTQPTATSVPGASSFSIAPTNLNYNTTMGQPDPTGQIVTITNTGSSSLQWQASSSVSWLTVSPQQNTISANQSEQVIVSVNVAQLHVGNYNTLMVISAAGGATTQQNIAISVAVAAPCTLQVNPTSLSFSVTTLNPKAAPQNIILALAGGCSQSVAWKAAVDQSWLILSSTSGTNGATITVSISTTLPVPGTHYAHITLSASSSGSAVPVSPQTIPVTLVVSL